MKLSKLNGLLLVLNLAGLGYIGHFLYRQANKPEVTEPEQTPLVQAKETSPATVPTPTVVKEFVTVTNSFRWAQLESENYRDYIQRLRAIGCPEQTIRDIIISDLDKLIAPRVQANSGRRKDLKYWHPEEEELANNNDPRRQSREERAIDKEKRQIIQELLGVDLVRERMKQKGQEDYYERRLSFLPEDKRSQMRQLLDKFDDQMQELRDKEFSEGTLSTADQEQLAILNAKRQTELNALLSPAEREQYELWMSPTANAVRHSVYGMEATEDEFLAIYKARKQFEEQWNKWDGSLMDDATWQRYQAARKQSDDSIRQALGDQRYAEYRRGDDEEFHQLNAVISRYQLPRTVAAQVYEVRKIAQDMRRSVEANQTLQPSQRELALKEMNEETERTIKQKLGDKAYQYYQHRNSGTGN